MTMSADGTTRSSSGSTPRRQRGRVGGAVMGVLRSAVGLRCRGADAARRAARAPGAVGRRHRAAGRVAPRDGGGPLTGDGMTVVPVTPLATAGPGTCQAG